MVSCSILHGFAPTSLQLEAGTLRLLVRACSCLNREGLRSCEVILGIGRAPKGEAVMETAGQAAAKNVLCQVCVQSTYGWPECSRPNVLRTEDGARMTATVQI